ncbi:MAG: TVP38/TMEM64 family protein [Candidatus Diapherotrites archaeon]
MNWKEDGPQLLFLLAIGFIAIIPVLVPELSKPFALWVKENVNATGIWGPIVMVVLMIVATIFSPIPNSVITLIIGATYGPVFGTFLAITASVIAASVAFFLSRKIAKRLVEKYFPESHFIHKFLTNNGFLSIFVLRMIPSVSFDMVSYGVGLTKIPFRTFILATFFGVIPGTVSVILVGSGFTFDSNLSIIGVVFYALLIIIGVFASHRMGFFDEMKKKK